MFNYMKDKINIIEKLIPAFGLDLIIIILSAVTISSIIVALCSYIKISFPRVLVLCLIGNTIGYLGLLGITYFTNSSNLIFVLVCVFIITILLKSLVNKILEKISKR